MFWREREKKISFALMKLAFALNLFYFGPDFYCRPIRHNQPTRMRSGQYEEWQKHVPLWKWRYETTRVSSEPTRKRKKTFLSSFFFFFFFLYKSFFFLLSVFTLKHIFASINKGKSNNFVHHFYQGEHILD